MYYTRLPVNKITAWEHAVSWGITALDNQIQRLDEFAISSAYDRSRRADLLELHTYLKDCLRLWHEGNLEYVVSSKTRVADK